MKNIGTLLILLFVSVSTFAKGETPLELNDTVYQYDKTKDFWESFIVIDVENLIVENKYLIKRGKIKSLIDGKIKENVYQRGVFDNDYVSENASYVFKEELIRYLKKTNKFTFSLKKIIKKKGNVSSNVTKSAKLNELSYSDANVSFKWNWGDNKYFGLLLENKSSTVPLSIIWSDATYIDMDGNSSDLQHSTSLNKVSEDKTATKMMENTKRTEYIIPTSCIFRNGPLITYFIELNKHINNNTNEVRLCIPIKIGNIITRYDFYFTIGSITLYDFYKSQNKIDF